jgi:hypothetical protein
VRRLGRTRALPTLSSSLTRRSNMVTVLLASTCQRHYVALAVEDGSRQTFVKRTAPNRPMSAHDERAAETAKRLHMPAFRSMGPYQPNGRNAAHNLKVAGSNPAPATHRRFAFAGLFVS